MAYQIGFDLYESAPQNFLIQIQDSLTSLVPKSPSPPAVVAATQQKADEVEQAAVAAGQDEETAMETEADNSGEAEAASNDEKKKEDSEGESAHQQKTESATSGATT